MEVHPPDHAIRSWRDFIIHIATIVVGLLIAIGLEQSVEALHHRHLLHQAREQIHEEMVENRETAARDRHFLEVAALDSRYNIDLLDSRSQDKVQKLRFGWRWDALQSSAWTSARETGALALMPYAEVQALATLYLQQDLVNAEAKEHIHHYAESLAPLTRHGNVSNVAMSDLSPQERDLLANGFAVNLTEIGTLRDLLRPLEEQHPVQEQH